MSTAFTQMSERASACGPALDHPSGSRQSAVPCANDFAKRSKQMSNDGVAAVERALAILAAFQPDGAPRSLHDLAAKTGMYKSTILRLIASLERFNCVLRLPDGRYQLGPSLFHWGDIYRRSLK